MRSQGEYFEGDYGIIVPGLLLFFLILIDWILSGQTMYFINSYNQTGTLYCKWIVNIRDGFINAN